MSKQSSVEWLKECLSIHFTHEQKMQFEGLFQQAKAMHKEEVTDAYIDGHSTWGVSRNAEQYYNEIFGDEKVL